MENEDTEAGVHDRAPSAYADAKPDEINDALIVIGRMTNRIPANWAQPDKDVTGLSTVAELMLILASSNDLAIKPSMVNGLAAAAVILADSIDGGGLDRAQLRSPA